MGNFYFHCSTQITVLGDIFKYHCRTKITVFMNPKMQKNSFVSYPTFGHWGPWYVILFYLFGRSLLTKTPLFSSNKITSKKSKEQWTKRPDWNNAVYEKKEKYHYFTHPAQDYNNAHLNLNQRERMGTWEKKETHTRNKKK